MGAIQSSINQMLGTVAAVTTGAKHIKEQEEAAESAAYTEYHTRDAEFGKLTTELEGTGGLNDQLKEAKTASDEADKKLTDYESKVGIAPTPEQKLGAAITGEPIKQDLSKLTKGQKSYLTRLQKKKESMNKAFESLNTEVGSKKTQLSLIEKRMNELNKKYKFEGSK